MSSTALQQAPPTPEEIAFQKRFLPLVRRIAMKTARRLPSTISVDDLVGIGWVGLLNAWKTDHGQMNDEQVEAFCAYRVRGAILDHLRTLDPMCRRLRGASRRISSAISTLEARLMRAPESSEIAGELGVPVEEYLELLSEISRAGMASLDVAELPSHAEAERTPETLFGKKELNEVVAAAIEELPERLRVVLALYYTEDCTLREIGEVLDVTESRACQLHSEAIHRVRSRIHRSSRRQGRLS